MVRNETAQSTKSLIATELEEQQITIHSTGEICVRLAYSLPGGLQGPQFRDDFSHSPLVPLIALDTLHLDYDIR